MRRWMIALMLALGLTLPVAASQPASATYPTNTTPTLCHTFGHYSDVVCSYISWRKQDDGTGVVLLGLHVWISRGCGDLESPPMNPAEAAWYRLDNGNTDYSWSFGSEDCSWSKSFTNAGSDTGGMQFIWNAHMRIDLAYDREVWQGWDIYPNGDSVVTINTDTACPC